MGLTSHRHKIDYYIEATARWKTVIRHEHDIIGKRTTSLQPDAQLGKFAGRCSTFFILLPSGMFIHFLVIHSRRGLGRGSVEVALSQEFFQIAFSYRCILVVFIL